MDFALSSETRALRDKVVEFARTLGWQAAEYDKDGLLDREGWRRCAEFGVLGWGVPLEYGGSGYDPLMTAVAFEAFGYGCRDNGLVFAVNNHVWACLTYLLEYGDYEQRNYWLPRLCAGSAIGAHALTEPETGSDMLRITTSARREEDGWVLDGTKTYISNAPCADVFVVFARTREDGPADSALSAFVVPASTPGCQVTRHIGKVGLRGCPMGEITLRNCRLPVNALLGVEGAGYRMFTSTMEWERGFMFASQVGVLARLLELSVRRSTQRRQFGRPIGSFQALSHRIADMGVRLELARLLLYKIGWLKRENRMAMLESSMLKLFVSEALTEGALDTLRLHGAAGYTEDAGIERELRDAVGATVYGGTSEIQRNIIATLLGVPGDQ